MRGFRLALLVLQGYLFGRVRLCFMSCICDGSFGSGSFSRDNRGLLQRAFEGWFELKGRLRDLRLFDWPLVIFEGFAAWKHGEGRARYWTRASAGIARPEPALPPIGPVIAGPV